MQKEGCGTIVVLVLLLGLPAACAVEKADHDNEQISAARADALNALSRANSAAEQVDSLESRVEELEGILGRSR